MADDPFTPDLPIQLQGQLLLADPSLREGAFRRSVILLAEHDSNQGTFGLILNHPTGKTVGDFLQGEEFTPLRQLAVHRAVRVIACHPVQGVQAGTNATATEAAPCACLAAESAIRNLQSLL